MGTPTFAESVFFADLTRTLMQMKDAPFAEVEAKVEEQFRSFLRQRGANAETRSLAITFTWRLPDGPDGWAEYGTEYHTKPAPGSAAAVADRPRDHRPSGGRSADVIPFPKRAAGR